MKKIFLSAGFAFICLSLCSQVIHIDDAGDTKSAIKITYTTANKVENKLKPIPVQNIKLLNSIFSQRYELNRKYLMSLESDKLLQNFYYEAGISRGDHPMVSNEKDFSKFYWGWESPSNQLRGHFLGHWLSAAAYAYAATNDLELKFKADFIIKELADCQRNNGGQWAASIPEKYFDLMAKGEPIWSPQYTVHKTLMGLYDMYIMAGSEEALAVLDKFADWFHTWTGKQIENNNAGAVYRGEASGMFEIWSNMYGLTGKQKYLDLMERYGNPGLFQMLQDGKDALSSDHANASIPWSHGSARAYEVTGDKHWQDVTQAFWKNAVSERESFCTGGQNAGEFWIPPGQLSHFLCGTNQEHCTVYNMIRTADYLYRWTGKQEYADYIERNIYNGILAQQNPNTGMVAYFLPMASGYKKGGERGWGHPTMDFWCCHGSLVQAQTRYLEYIYFENDEGLVVSQYIPSVLKWKKDNVPVKLQQDFKSSQFSKDYALNRWAMDFKVEAEKPVQFAVQLRLPWWLKEKAIIKVNGVQEQVSVINGTHTINRTWHNDEISVEFPTKIYAETLSGTKNMVAFMEGPVVLAGITDKDVTLRGNISNPENIFVQEYEQEYKLVRWKQSHYRTTNQQPNIKFIPLYEIADENYAVYFQVEKEYLRKYDMSY